MRKYIKLITGLNPFADYPEGWGTSWLAPPAIVDNGDGTGAINGAAAMAWLLSSGVHNRAGFRLPQQPRLSDV